MVVSLYRKQRDNNKPTKNMNQFQHLRAAATLNRALQLIGATTEVAVVSNGEFKMLGDLNLCEQIRNDGGFSRSAEITCDGQEIKIKFFR